MPFAPKFRAMLDFPFPGDTIGDFIVEDVEVWDEKEDSEGHTYGIRMVVRGPGGKQAVQHVLRPLFTRHPTTFSGYGNPYQLWVARSEVTPLGDKRYEVRAKGMGVRTYPEPDLNRFLAHLERNGHLAVPLDPADREALIEDYLERYRREISLLVERYHRKLQKITGED
jgi:hypothetical protein